MKTKLLSVLYHVAKAMLLIFVLSLTSNYCQFHTLDEYQSFVMDVLHSLPQNTNSNVLDIRRQFPEAIRPDTRQLNRVLYQMEASNMITKGPPKSCNQKPTWTLA